LQDPQSFGIDASFSDNGLLANGRYPIRGDSGLAYFYAMMVKIPSSQNEDSRFVIQKVQPALLGLMDGSVSTLAPIFATAGLTGKPIQAFYVGLAASLGAGISMGLSEALSDDGLVTGRGKPLIRGAITALSTSIGGMLHTFPFLAADLKIALHIAYIVVVFELLAIALIRFRYMKTPLVYTILQVIIGGGIVFAIGILLGKFG
jgi:hypothetical protein